MAATVRIGTCSWADEALCRWFYPPKLPAKERLAWYARHFDTVEVDSTFYRLPAESAVAGWAERTPAGFTMHVKAFGLLTRHPVRVEAVPPDLRPELPLDEHGRVDRPPRELRAEVFRRFRAALEPLRAAGKLGGILFQLPPYVVCKPSSLAYLEWAREQLAGDEMLVEFRHRSWLDDEHRAASLAFLERLGATYVAVDAPRSETARNLVPTVVATTSPTAYVRFHGRNLATWNTRGRSARSWRRPWGRGCAPSRIGARRPRRTWLPAAPGRRGSQPGARRRARSGAGTRPASRRLRAARAPIRGRRATRACTRRRAEAGTGSLPACRPLAAARARRGSGGRPRPAARAAAGRRGRARRAAAPVAGRAGRPRP